MFDTSQTHGMSVIAVDHGQSFVRRMQRTRSHRVDEALVRELKEEIISALAAVGTMFVCDRFGSLDVVFKHVADPGRVIVGLPDITAEDEHDVWSTVPAHVELASALGCSGLKLCLILDRTSRLSEWKWRIEDAVARCKDRDLMIILEAVGAPRSSPPQAVARVAAVLAAFAPDMIKLPFPSGQRRTGLLRACEEVSAAAHSVPWMLLSGWASFETFSDRLAVAVSAGCAGFIAGSAVWQDALDIHDRHDRSQFLESTVLARAASLRTMTALRDESDGQKPGVPAAGIPDQQVRVHVGRVCPASHPTSAWPKWRVTRADGTTPGPREGGIAVTSSAGSPRWRQ